MGEMRGQTLISVDNVGEAKFSNSPLATEDERATGHPAYKVNGYKVIPVLWAITIGLISGMNCTGRMGWMAHRKWN